MPLSRKSRSSSDCRSGRVSGRSNTKGRCIDLPLSLFALVSQMNGHCYKLDFYVYFCFVTVAVKGNTMHTL